MALSSEEFIKQLKNDLESKKAFHDHPWVKKFERGELTKEQVRGWIEQQNYVTGIGINALKEVEAERPLDDEDRRLLVELIASLDIQAAATQSLLSERLVLVSIKGSDFAWQRNRAVRWYVSMRANPSHAQLVRVMRLMAEAIESSRLPPWEALPVVNDRYKQVYETLPWTEYICLPGMGDAWWKQ